MLYQGLVMSTVTSSIDFRGFFLAEKLVICFNVLDLLFTALYLTLGVATEANPLLAAAWELHPMAFVAAKSLLVGFGLAVLHVCRNRAAAQIGMGGALLVYAAVVGWHVIHLDHV